MTGDLHTGAGGEAAPVTGVASERAVATETTREAWNTRLGFVLAAVGSAVGLGNMWRFSYITAEKGGAAFVILYILMTLVVGIPILMAEFALGRGTRRSSIGALRLTGGPRWAPLGYLFIAAGILILSFYSVIAGWVMRYALRGIASGFPTEAAEYFDQIASGAPAMGFHLVFMIVTIGIVMGGVQKGIERASVIMMPALFLIVVGLAVWASTLAGSGAGYRFYLTPNFEALLSLDTLAAAASQAFFSLSLGMGCMLTFSSYLSRQESLPREATVISFADFSVAFISGLVVFPVIFALGLQGAVGASTLGALFISLPGAFLEMGGVGRIVGVLFFTALFIGALTSAISLLEVVVSALIDEWRIPRRTAAIGAGILITLIGLWPAADLNALGAIDAVVSNIFLPVGALGTALFVGWLMKNPIDEVAHGAADGLRPWLKGWLWTLRIVVPILLVLVLSSSLPATREALAGLFGGG